MTKRSNQFLIGVTAVTVLSGAIGGRAGLTPVGFQATGPLRYGMSMDEVERSMGLEHLDTSTRGSGWCEDRSVPLGQGDTVAAMFVDSRLVRVDVLEGDRQTVEGARIGDSEARIRELYGAAVAVSAHRYIDGHYLTVAGRDSTAMVFETDGRKVLSYRAGLLPEVSWIEGCS